jgi:hypothetical protein
MQSPPAPVRRPAFAQWLFDHDLDYQQAAKSLDSCRETIRLICLPFDHPKRRVPYGKLMERIVKWTGGRIRPADFYAPELNEAEVAA